MRSAGFRPACVTRTSTSEGSGTGSGRSPTDITSGPPAPRNVTAIIAWHDGRSDSRRASPGARRDRRRRQRALPRAARVPLRRHARPRARRRSRRSRPARIGRGGRGRHAVLRRARRRDHDARRRHRIRRRRCPAGRDRPRHRTDGARAGVRPAALADPVEAGVPPQSCAGSREGAASGSRPTRVRPSSRRSAATWPRTPAGRTPSSTGRPAHG